MSKLTAAIDILKELNGPADTITEHGTHDNAIRILEAAEKVDRDHCIRILDTLHRFYTENGPCLGGRERISHDGIILKLRALIESLPEEGMAESKK